MLTRSAVARGVATLALVAGLVGSSVVPSAFAADADHAITIEKKKAQNESSAESNDDMATTILDGIHFAADAADIVVPILVNFVHKGS